MILFFIIVFLTVIHSSICDVQIPTVAPVNRNAFNKILEDYLNWEFSKCRKYTKCDDDNPSKVYPIVRYFWPGDMLEIECMFCDNTKLINENPKIWRTMSIREAFDFNKTGEEKNWQYGDPDSPFWINLSIFASETIYELHEQSQKTWVLFSEDRPVPRFFQKEGKLIIVNPGLEVQGVYNCYEGGAQNSIQIVYILIAMAPLTQTPCRIAENVSNTKNYGKNYMCNWEDGQYFAGKNILHFVYFNTAWHHRYFPVPISKYFYKDPDLISQEDPPKMLNIGMGVINGSESDNLNLTFAWSEWTECSACRPFRGWRTREGHCYFVKNVHDLDIYSGKRVYAIDSKDPYCCYVNGPIDYYSEHKYKFTEQQKIEDKKNLLKLEKLNDVLSSYKLPFRNQGIRLHSAFMLEVLCSQGRGIQYDPQENNCLRDWLKLVYFTSWRVPGNYTKPKNRPDGKNMLKKFMPCFDYRTWNDVDSSLKFGANEDFDLKNGLAAEIVGGYYHDIEQCVRDCPKLNPYFPNP